MRSIVATKLDVCLDKHHVPGIHRLPSSRNPQASPNKLQHDFSSVMESSVVTTNGDRGGGVHCLSFSPPLALLTNFLIAQLKVFREAAVRGWLIMD